MHTPATQLSSRSQYIACNAPLFGRNERATFLVQQQRRLSRHKTLVNSSSSGSMNQSSSSMNIPTDGEMRKTFQEDMNAEITAAVVRGMEMEKRMVQETVAEAVGTAMENSAKGFDLRANVNTLVALTGVVIFERGVWESWDLYFGDNDLSNAISIGVGLAIMVSVPLFRIPLAEWRQPKP